MIRAVGPQKAAQIAREQASWVERTNNWAENYAPTFASIDDLLDREPGRLVELYVQAWPILDHPGYCALFKAAGYDGAIHCGSGKTMDEAEYKIFEPGQARAAEPVRRMTYT